ncbi:MAG: CHAD domain-containing protein, partial [Myxococcota bacterium]
MGDATLHPSEPTSTASDRPLPGAAPQRQEPTVEALSPDPHPPKEAVRVSKPMTTEARQGGGAMQVQEAVGAQEAMGADDGLALHVRVPTIVMDTLRHPPESGPKEAQGQQGNDLVLCLSAAWDLAVASEDGSPGRLLEARAELMPRASWEASTPMLAPPEQNLLALPPAPLERRWASPVTFAPMQLPRRITVANTLAWIGRQSLVTLMANLEPAAQGDDPEGVHQARVAIRRLRSALQLFRPVIGRDEAYAHLKQELRWLAGELGEARDLDVMAEEYVPLARRELGRRSTAPLAASLELARLEAQERAAAAIASERTWALLGALATWLETRGWTEALSKKERKPLDRPMRTLAPRWLDAVCLRVERKGKATQWFTLFFAQCFGPAACL